MLEAVKEVLSRPGLLAAYPSWYQLVLVVWLFVTAILVAGFLLVKPVDPSSNKAETPVGSAAAEAPTISPQQLRAEPEPLRQLDEVEHDLPRKRMPRGTYGYAMALRDSAQVSREAKPWYVQVQRRADGSFWALGYVSAETRARFDQWKSDEKIDELQFLLFSETWEQAPDQIAVPLAALSTDQRFDFRKSSRFEVLLSKKKRDN